MTLNTKPPGATHWSVRTMAKGVRHLAGGVQRIWKAHGLKPHLTRRFKLSRDPKFAAKVADVVGLYPTRPTRRWCCASTRRARSRRWIAPSQDCR